MQATRRLASLAVQGRQTDATEWLKGSHRKQGRHVPSNSFPIDSLNHLLRHFSFYIAPMIPMLSRSTSSRKLGNPSADKALLLSPLEGWGFCSTTNTSQGHCTHRIEKKRESMQMQGYGGEYEWG
eukprot:RCo021629